VGSQSFHQAIRAINPFSSHQSKLYVLSGFVWVDKYHHNVPQLCVALSRAKGIDFVYRRTGGTCDAFIATPSLTASETTVWVAASFWP
jgi:hypothetical protein